MAAKLNNLRTWLAEALEFTLGNPKGNNMPPSIGPQPYHEKPSKVH